MSWHGCPASSSIHHFFPPSLPPSLLPSLVPQVVIYKTKGQKPLSRGQRFVYAFVRVRREGRKEGGREGGKEGRGEGREGIHQRPLSRGQRFVYVFVREGGREDEDDFPPILSGRQRGGRGGREGGREGAIIHSYHTNCTAPNQKGALHPAQGPREQQQGKTDKTLTTTIVGLENTHTVGSSMNPLSSPPSLSRRRTETNSQI